MTDSALEIMATTGRNIIHAYNLRSIELHGLTGTNRPEFHQVYDVMAHLFVHDVVALNTYGVTDNLRGIARFGEEVKKLLFKWLNRRGKRGCLNWRKFNEMLKRFPLPKPRIRVSMFALSVN